MERRVLLEDLQEQVASCMLNVLKLSPRTVYGQNSAYMKAVLDYCAKYGEKYYNPVLLNKFWAETEARYKRGEITNLHARRTGTTRNETCGRIEAAERLPPLLGDQPE